MSTPLESARPVIERRPILKALGAGAALSLGSGVAAAEAGSDGADIDAQYGYATPDGDSVPDEFDPDYEVELHVDLPADLENPERPPLFHFEPTGLAVDPGDVVQFTAVQPDHSVTAYHPGQGFQRRVPEGVPPFSSPVLNAGGAWLYRFDTEGVYDVYCSSHHLLGMVMRLVVGDVETTPAYVGTFEGQPATDDQPLLFAPFSQAFLEGELNAVSDANDDCEWPWVTPVEVLDAPALDPENIQDEETVPFEDVLADIDRFPDVETHAESAD